MLNKEHRSFEDLRELTLQWASDRDLLSKGNIEGQSRKVSEEVTEMLLAAMKTLYNPSPNHYAELVDGIGDTLVTVIILSELFNCNPTRALGAAFDEIKDRTGTTIDGQFKKDEQHTEQDSGEQERVSGAPDPEPLRVLSGPTEEPDGSSPTG